MTSPTTAGTGLRRAIEVARKAARRVPAYTAHLAESGRPLPITRDDFDRLPPMTKDNYLRRYGLADQLLDGRATSAGTWSASSGSTGTPTFWPRDEHALAESAVFYDRILTTFGSRERSTLVIDAFAMGSWIGGTYTYTGTLALRERGHLISVATPGIDADAVLSCLMDLGPRYEQVVLAGYPPFVKDVLDAAGGDVLRQDIALLLAGETITEAWRDHVLRRLGIAGSPERVCLMYGTADAGIMGHETPVTCGVRRAARLGTQLADALFERDCATLPTFVEYDVDRRFAEVDDEGFLLFTIDAARPLVRYRINDIGRLYTAAQLITILLQHGETELATTVHPEANFLVLYGRPDVVATFYSLNIYPEGLRAAFDDPAVAARLTGKFVIPSDDGLEGPPTLRVQAELARGDAGDDALRSLLARLCATALATSNGEYRALRASKGDVVDPVVTLHSYGDAPFTTDIKHRWIGATR